MDPPSVILTLVTGSVLAGSLLIVVLSLSYHSWPPIASAVGVGLLLTWPAAYVISRWIKRDAPGWHRRVARAKSRTNAAPIFLKPDVFGGSYHVTN